MADGSRPGTTHAIEHSFGMSRIFHLLQASRQLGRQALAAIDHVLAHAGELSVPLLVLHGGADRLTFPSGSEALAAGVRGDCTLHVHDGLYHELAGRPDVAVVVAPRARAGGRLR